MSSSVFTPNSLSIPTQSPDPPVRKCKTGRRISVFLISTTMAGGIAITSVPPAHAFLDTLLGLASGFIQQQTGVDISQYNQVAQQFLSAIRTGNYSTFLSSLGQLLGQKYAGQLNGSVGDMGEIDWEMLMQALSDTVDDQIQIDQSGTSDQPGAVSSGIHSKKYGVLPTTEKWILRDGMLSNLGESQLNVLLGADGQKFLSEERQQVAKIAETSNNAAKSEQKMDNTQDVLKAQGVQLGAISQLAERNKEQQLQTTLALWENNRTGLRQLKYAQAERWAKSVQESFDQQNLAASTNTFISFLEPQSQSQSQSSPSGGGTSSPAIGGVLGSGTNTSVLTTPPFIGTPTNP